MAIVNIQLKTHVFDGFLSSYTDRSDDWEVNYHLGSRSTAALLQHWTNSTRTPVSHLHVTRARNKPRLTPRSLFFLITSRFRKYTAHIQKVEPLNSLNTDFHPEIFTFFFSPKRPKRPGHCWCGRCWCGVKEWGRRGCREDRLWPPHADVNSAGCKLSKENTLEQKLNF